MADNKCLKYRQLVERKLRTILEYKTKEYSPDDLIKTLTMTDSDLTVEDSENSQFRQFLDIAWENCENVEKTKSLLDEHLAKIKEAFNASYVLQHVIVYYEYLTETAKIEFEKNAAEYRDAIKLICLKRTSSSSSSTMLKSCGGNVIDLVPIEKRFDKFGPWQNDPLQSHLKLYVALPGDKDFPKNWRTDAQKTKFEVKLYESNKSSLIKSLANNNKLTLSAFLQNELNLPDAESVEQMVTIFKKKILNTVDDLAMITDWSEFSSSIPEHYRTRLQIAVQRYSGNKKKEEDATKRSSAELASDWHKVRLFLYYESGMEAKFKVYLYSLIIICYCFFTT
jgi:hypothetical protein